MVAGLAVNIRRVTYCQLLLGQAPNPQIRCLDDKAWKGSCLHRFSSRASIVPSSFNHSSEAPAIFQGLPVLGKFEDRRR